MKAYIILVVYVTNLFSFVTKSTCNSLKSKTFPDRFDQLVRIKTKMLKKLYFLLLSRKQRNTSVVIQLSDQDI